MTSPSPKSVHTGGPWRVVENDGAYVKEGGLASLRIEGGPHELVVALVVSDIAALNHEANARLIAAAPELLAALRLMLLTHDASCPGEDCQIAGVDLARFAIAKATGATS